MNKGFKLGGLLGLVATVGYGVYAKKKATLKQEQEIIDISPEETKEQNNTRK